MAKDRVWRWSVDEAFNPKYDVTASAEGLSYACEIQGPFCGYDHVATQSWDEFLALGPPAKVEMPPDIAVEIRAHAVDRHGNRR